MAEAVIRRDVWGLEEEQSWHPILEAYAFAVAAMQERDSEDPTSWAYQAAVHGVATGEPPDDFRNQCQHRTWFFLPWHRMYLAYFEQIVESIPPPREVRTDSLQLLVANLVVGLQQDGVRPRERVNRRRQRREAQHHESPDHLTLDLGAVARRVLGSLENYAIPKDASPPPCPPNYSPGLRAPPTLLSR